MIFTVQWIFLIKKDFSLLFFFFLFNLQRLDTILLVVLYNRLLQFNFYHHQIILIKKHFLSDINNHSHYFIASQIIEKIYFSFLIFTFFWIANRFLDSFIYLFNINTCDYHLILKIKLMKLICYHTFKVFH